MAMQTCRDPLLAGPYRMMDGLLRNRSANRTTGYTPLLDVHETHGEYLVLIDLPGLNSEEAETGQEAASIRASHRRRSGRTDGRPLPA